MQGGAQLRQRLIRAQTAVDMIIIGRVVAVGGGLEQRPQVQGIDSQLFEVGDPGIQLLQARVGGCGEVVALGRAGQAEGVNVVEDGVIRPVGHITSKEGLVYLPVLKPSRGGIQCER